MDDDTFDEYAVIIYMAVLRRKVRFYLLANSALRQLKKTAYFFVLPIKTLWYSAVIQDNLGMFTRCPIGNINLTSEQAALPGRV